MSKKAAGEHLEQETDAKGTRTLERIAVDNAAKH